MEVSGVGRGRRLMVVCQWSGKGEETDGGVSVEVSGVGRGRRLMVVCQWR